jgi:hypothetical protein
MLSFFGLLVSCDYLTLPLGRVSISLALVFSVPVLSAGSCLALASETSGLFDFCGGGASGGFKSPLCFRANTLLSGPLSFLLILTAVGALPAFILSAKERPIGQVSRETTFFEEARSIFVVESLIAEP